MSDFSAYYRIVFGSLDGATVVSDAAWTPAAPSQYREVGVPALGRFPVELFTRAVSDQGGTSPPIVIMKEGGVLRVRAPDVSPAAEIGIIPGDNPTSVVTQRQRLTKDPDAELWAFPGDELWAYDPLGTRGRLDIFVKPMSFRDVDGFLRLPEPRRNSGDTLAGGALVPVGNVGDIPPPRANPMVYVLTPPAPNHAYALPVPTLLGPGVDLTFANTSNVRCRLVSPVPIHAPGQPSEITLAPLSTITLTSLVSTYTETAGESDQLVQINAVTALQVWRGLLRINSTANLTLPGTIGLDGRARTSITNNGGANIIVAPMAGQLINNQASLTIVPDTSWLLLPSGSGWQAM